VPPVDHDVVGGGCEGVDEVPNEMGNEMLPFEAASVVPRRAELRALRTQHRKQADYGEGSRPSAFHVARVTALV
jgi:hypothetical protein